MDVTVKEEGGFSYIEEGQGDVLLLLHGLFGALSNFQGILEEFRSRSKVVIPLLPIYEMPLLQATVRGLVDHVHRFVRFKNYDQVILVGNSLGGHVALMYALMYPQKVRAMVLTGSSGLFENTLGGTFPKRGDYNFIKEKTEYTFYDPKTATKELVDEVYEICNNRSKAMRVISMARSAMKEHLGPHLHKLQMPVLLIWGKEDRITPPFVGEEFHKLLPNSELVLIDQCGHAPMMEKPHEFNVILEEFLQKLNVGIEP
ncbi:MAG: alpha/beta hydrolase [Chitinophagales bacterium]|nr:alpha/beta hydrolase [Chitinophagales bacterium]MDW8392931.1 alpha/beta hydrolase [Chitinophagales bacterium]